MISYTDQDRNDRLWERLVPPSGPADTVGGELLRAANRLVDRWYNDGDRVDEDYGRKTCNPAARYVQYAGRGKTPLLAVRLWDYLLGDDEYERTLDSLLAAVLDEVEAEPERLCRSNFENFDIDFRRDEDAEMEA